MEQLEYEETPETAEWLEHPETKRFREYLKVCKEQMAQFPLERCLTLEPQRLAQEMQRHLSRVAVLSELEAILTKEADHAE